VSAALPGGYALRGLGEQDAPELHPPIERNRERLAR
jgi:hypothetical protein